MENSGGGFKPLDAIGKGVNKISAESRIPTEEYQSTMKIYGGSIKRDPEGKMVFDRRGPVSRIDKTLDPLFRTPDEHTMRNPLALLRRHPRWFFRFLFPGPKRYRGSQTEIEANIQRLGLEDYYGPHPWGFEIKKPEIFTKGIPFQDIFRSDQVNSKRLDGLDRFQALEEVAKYMRQVHDTRGAIGEGVPYRFIFQKRDGDRALDPVLFLPDIVFNQRKQIPEAEQKAIDYLEFLIAIGFEELRRTNDLSQVDKILDTANKAYSDPKIIGVAKSFAKRGRVTLNNPVLSIHNKFHIGFDRKYTDEIRQKIIESCTRFSQNPNTQGDPSPS